MSMAVVSTSPRVSERATERERTVSIRGKRLIFCETFSNVKFMAFVSTSEERPITTEHVLHVWRCKQASACAWESTASADVLAPFGAHLQRPSTTMCAQSRFYCCVSVRVFTSRVCDPQPSGRWQRIHKKEAKSRAHKYSEGFIHSGADQSRRAPSPRAAGRFAHCPVKNFSLRLLNYTILYFCRENVL